MRFLSKTIGKFFGKSYALMFTCTGQWTPCTMYVNFPGTPGFIKAGKLF